MIKKLIIGGGVLTLLVVLIFGTGVFSYVRTSAGYIKDSVRCSVPVEFEIERARGLIDDLLPDLKRLMYSIAKHETEINHLNERIEKHRGHLAQKKEEILRLTSDLESGNGTYCYGGNEYTEEQVRFDLEQRLERYQRGEATLEDLEKIRTVRQRSLAADRQQLEATQAEKRNLEVAVEELEAKMQMIAAARASSSYEFDDSRLGQAKELIAELRTRLEVDEKLLAIEGHFDGEIPLDRPASEDIVKRVTKHFSEDAEIPVAEALASND